MHLLLDPLPKTIELKGIPHKIDTDFKTMLIIEELIEDESIKEGARLARALELLYIDEINPLLLDEAIEGLFWYWSMGNEKEDRGNQPEEKVDTSPIFSYRYDAPYIYSAFKAQYNIDLIDEDLHWWKFLSLFKGLSEEHELSKILGYRSKKITSEMSKEEKKFYREMKQLYKIPDGRTMEEKEAAIGNLFWG